MSKLLNDFISYAKINTRSNEKATTVPTSAGQIVLAKTLEKQLLAMELTNIVYHEKNGFLIACLPGNCESLTLGFIAHLDTADFEAEEIQPQIWEDYDGGDLLLNKEFGIIMKVQEFPNLKDYLGETLITTNGLTLLGADDKAGIAEIIAMLRYFQKHPEIPRGDVWVAFGPDEEIGRGADLFEVADFPVSYAYTVDSGRVGHVEYETFNAAKMEITIEGTSVHPGTAYGQLVNAIKLGEAIDGNLPQAEVPEKTQGYQGFYLLNSFAGTIEHAELSYIIRDHHRETFEARKENLVRIIEKINQQLDYPRITYQLADQYFNMAEVINQHPLVMALAIEAMKNNGITPIVTPFRGGTDGSKISFKGLPTANIFTGGENFHGKYEFISLEAMEKARDTLIEMVRLAAKQAKK